MRVSSYNPTLPVANAGSVTAIGAINSVAFNHQRMDWWDVVTSQFGNRVTDMLKESFYGKNFQPSILKQPPTSDWLRVTLENEIRYAQEQQMAYTHEAMEQDKQIRIAQIHAKSDAWLQEKAQIKAQQEAELAALEQTQMLPESHISESHLMDTQESHMEHEISAIQQSQAEIEAVEKVAGEATEATTEPEDKNASQQADSDTEASKLANEAQEKEDEKDGKLNAEEQRVVNELQSIDRNVKNHEAAHLGAAGGLAQGGANYTYTEGPDGKLYATAGEVSIDTSSTGDPKKDLQKAQQIQAAAMAPSDPSPQDYRVAASVTIMQMKAQMQLSEEFSEGVKKEQGMKIYKTNIENIQRSESAPMSFRVVA